MARRKKAFDGLLMTDAEILEAALIGLERRRSELEEKMAELRREIGGDRVGRPVRQPAGLDAAAPVAKKRTMSAAGRRRTAAAQRKRWAALKERAAEERKPVKKKRRMSAAGRARIVAATKKRWAAFHAKKTAGK